MIYSSIGFKECIRIVIIFCIIVALFINHLKQGKSVVGKISSSENSYKVIAIICERSEGDVNNKMEFF